ncbi:hypothetical protein MMC12_006063 [Toensbergia leucococca]|nr:hypothetical protein [Toensbergia leucococca]
MSQNEKLADSKAIASFAGRLGASAVGLVRDSLLPSSSSTVTSSLASATANRTKGDAGPSSAGHYRTSPLDTWTQKLEPIGLDRSTRPSFRSLTSYPRDDQEHAQFDFDDFMNSSYETEFLPISEGIVASQSQAYQFALEAAWPPVAMKQRSLGPRFHEASQSNAGEEARANQDGAAVVALLSDPDFTVEDEPAMTWSIATNDLVRNSYEGRPNGSRSELQGLSTNPHVFHVSPFDLLPTFTVPSLGPETSDTVTFTTTVSHTNKSNVYATSISSSTNDHLQPWLDMLTTYQDEVWGDVLPLVQEFREGIRGALEGKSVFLPSHPALGRLRMILGHVGLPSKEMSRKFRTGLEQLEMDTAFSTHGKSPT